LPFTTARLRTAHPATWVKTERSYEQAYNITDVGGKRFETFEYPSPVHHACGIYYPTFSLTAFPRTRAPYSRAARRFLIARREHGTRGISPPLALLNRLATYRANAV